MNSSHLENNIKVESIQIKSKDIFEKIKSKFILKKILNNLERKKLLNLIKYNKNLKNRININIDKY